MMGLRTSYDYSLARFEALRASPLDNLAFVLWRWARPTFTWQDIADVTESSLHTTLQRAAILECWGEASPLFLPTQEDRNIFRVTGTFLVTYSAIRMRARCLPEMTHAWTQAPFGEVLSVSYLTDRPLFHFYFNSRSIQYPHQVDAGDLDPELKTLFLAQAMHILDAEESSLRRTN